MEHFSHKHPLILSKYNHSPPNAVCSACCDPISSNTDFYHCTHQSIDSPCTHFLLHKACADSPMVIQHPLHEELVLILYPPNEISWCDPCNEGVARWIYFSRLDQEGLGHLRVCIKCAFLERRLHHPSHTHPLTLLPMKATLRRCTACGMQGIEDFSYLCQTCLFWIHKGCASAPPSLIREDHDHDHPLLLAYSLPEEYDDVGVSCYLCSADIHSRFRCWVYYCADCRYFAHLYCALSAESRKDGNENDDMRAVEGSDFVHFPICDDEPYLFYQLIQQFANKFSISTNQESGKADIISECRSGHSLILFDNFNTESAVETNICDGCVQPLLSPPHPFYGCLDCNFFLHTLCATELPREIENRLTKLTRCYETSKPFDFYVCGVCDKLCNGIVYYDETKKYWVDVLCASLPDKIKHDCHKHALHHLSYLSWSENCRACHTSICSHCFACEKCDYYIHIYCALNRRTIKHRWDEHHLSLVYPPVKGHPQAFNCELCSVDINPNFWFYHCGKCDTSFHAFCVDQDVYSNIKYGGTVKDDNLHQHPIQLNGSKQKFKCAECGINMPGVYSWGGAHFFFNRTLLIQCASCKFLICMNCIISHYGSSDPRGKWFQEFIICTQFS